MRIIGGTMKGKKLATFSGRHIRPTPDRVREAIFSILFSRAGTLSGNSVLDLFSGTGAMALEALSRGAGRAVLIDQGAEAARLITENLRACEFLERAEFRSQDVLSALPRLPAERPFDLIFLDPPYRKGLVPTVLEAIAVRGLLAPGGWIVAEEARGEDVAPLPGGLVLCESRNYGATAVHLLTHNEQKAQG